MKQYISKSALIAEIERKIKERDFQMKSGCWVSSTYMYEDLLDFIDTIEVKEVDFENSMVCEAKWHDGFLLDYTQEQQDALLEKIGANVGDKIRVILIKK